MDFRSMFKKIFNKNPTDNGNGSYAVHATINNSVNLYAAGDPTAYQNLFVRICIDAVAENAAKLAPKVHKKVDGKIIPVDTHLQNLLELQPNEYMNAFDFYYKVVTLWALDNNAFIYIKRNPITGKVDGLYPIAYSNSQFLEYQGELFVQFTFQSGFRMTVPYGDLCHLRRFFGPNDLFGEDNEKTLKQQTGLLNVVNKGFAAAVNSNNKLKGILKVNINMQDDEIKEARDKFVNDYINLNNGGGVAALDTRMEYQELKHTSVLADDGHMKIIRQDIMSYYHVSEGILLGNYTEEDWNAFYESVLEPIGIRLGLEMTRKIFSNRAIGFGNRIVFEANRLQYVSAKNKTTILEKLIPMGLLSINEGREILNLAPIEGGEKRLMSLNYIDADKALEYQLGLKQKSRKGG